MDNEILKQLQNVELDMLKELDRICKKNGIKYWLDSGTMLGAIRHKGFIPWDDDIDVGMLRSDYDKFLQLAPGELSELYYLQNWYTDRDYGYPFSKIVKKNTEYRLYLDRNTNTASGIFLDIFPIDNYPEKRFQRFVQKAGVTFSKSIIKYQCGYDMTSGRPIVKKMLYSPMKWISNMIPREDAIAIYERSVRRYNTIQTKEYFGCNAVSYGKYIIKAEWLGNLTEVCFEDSYFPCPDDYDSWLRMNYGDYMKLPPIEERESGHGAISISFDTRKQ